MNSLSFSSSLTIVYMILLSSCHSEKAGPSTINLLWSSSSNLKISEDMKAHITKVADQKMDIGPFSVLQKAFVPPSGDKNDYMSMGVYWWPNPDTEDSLPYIRRDGFVNPEVHKITDKRYLSSTTDVAFITALAYQLTGDEKYAEKAIEVLRSWYINDSTAMNPNLNFGQGVPGRTDGRCYGIIETRYISKVLDAESMISDSSQWTTEDSKSLKNWFRKYVTWLLESDLGKEEFTRLNNHGTWYDVQVSSIAIALGEMDVAKEILTRSSERILEHIDSAGKQPLELARTRSWDYSVMNLRSLMLLATLGEQIGMDLWSIPHEQDPAIKRALNFLVAHTLSPNDWPYEQLKEFNPSVLLPLLDEATTQYPEDKPQYNEMRHLLGSSDKMYLGFYNL